VKLGIRAAASRPLAYGEVQLWLGKEGETALMMGCGGSKEAPSESIPLEQPRVATTRAPTSHRPRTSQNRPVSKQHSQRLPSSSTRPFSNSERPSSSSPLPSFSSNQPSRSNRTSSSKRASSRRVGGRPERIHVRQTRTYEDNISEDNDTTGAQ